MQEIVFLGMAYVGLIWFFLNGKAKTGINIVGVICLVIVFVILVMKNTFRGGA